MSRTYRKSPIWADKAFGHYWYCYPEIPGESNWTDLKNFVKEHFDDNSCRWSTFPYSFSGREIHGVRHRDFGSDRGSNTYWKTMSHRRARHVAKQCLHMEKEIPKYKGNNGYGWV